MKISKEYIYDDSNGTVIFNDNRNFDDCVIYQLKIIREKAKELITTAVPEYKQRNAALGLLSDEETQQIKDSIQAIRTISNQKEAEILAVVWDGQESTRAEACDIVQRIFWE
jgi:hypothetical protein